MNAERWRWSSIIVLGPNDFAEEVCALRPFSLRSVMSGPARTTLGAEDGYSRRRHRARRPAVGIARCILYGLNSLLTKASDFPGSVYACVFYAYDKLIAWNRSRAWLNIRISLPFKLKRRRPGRANRY